MSTTPIDTKQSDLPPVAANAQNFTAGLLAGAQNGAAHRFARAGKVRTIACMVTHGMGQQVPFETVSQIGEAFVRGRTPDSVEVNRVQLTAGADLISRLELIYGANEHTPETHVHIYEGYWAPLTEGKITFLKTLLFLFSGAWEGIKSCARSSRHFVNKKSPAGFARWIFGRLYNLNIKAGTLSQLLLTAFVIAGAVGMFYLCEIKLQALYETLKHHWNPPLSRAAATFWHLFWAKFKDLWSILSTGHPLSFLGALIAFFAAPIVVIASIAYILIMRFAVIEYVGDVAIYVSAYKVSAFEEVRKAIQNAVFDVAHQLFEATNPAGGPGHFYDDVIFLGHSLGSVITYDTLNALIVWDVFSKQGRYNVTGRTKRLITFGSPLDKTAFLFRTQISPEHHYREALAALQQPIVLDYKLRPFPWVNLYSHCDVVSGKLIYYDIPNPESDLTNYNPIDNRIDPAAWIPLLAHVQYWNGDLLRDLLQEAIR